MVIWVILPIFLAFGSLSSYSHIFTAKLARNVPKCLQ